jgi:F-type H+-transporting ATPase subunit epsilon
MPGTFHVTVLTPEAPVLEAEVTQVQVPSHDGLVGVLTKRAPLLTKLGTGVMRVDTIKGSQKYVITGGYAQMKEDVLTILADEAIPAASITPEAIAKVDGSLKAVTGTDTPAMLKRQQLQARLVAMRSVNA